MSSNEKIDLQSVDGAQLLICRVIPLQSVHREKKKVVDTLTPGEKKNEVKRMWTAKIRIEKKDWKK